MEWTVEKPTKEGWYWHKVENFRPEIVSVELDGSCMMIFQTEIEEPTPVFNSLGYWAGPIKEPKDIVK